jgi:glycosyltransferase involved in cell wall biosynthesis
VPHGDLPSLVAAADVFAFPSTAEGFGLAAMEALAAGVPVVTRDLPVLREVFGGAARFGTDASGLAAALGDALDHPDPALTEAGRALAARHTWAAAAERHLGLYRSLAAAGAL